MNTALLQRVASRIKSAPDTFRMGAYITEIGDVTCGCIAVHAIAEAQGKPLDRISAWSDTVPDGAEAALATKLLEITPEQARCLFHLGMWPVEYRLLYKRERAKAAVKRIEWFIVTNGVE